MPARLAPWPQASRTTLWRCLWLAGLLHLWALLWLGSAPEGTAPPGQGVAGRLNVTLRGPSDEGLPSAPPPQAGPALAADPAAAPRIGGRVRDTPLPPEATPGSERVGPTPALPAPPPASPILPAIAPSVAPLNAPLNTPPIAQVPAAPPAVAPPLPELAPLPSAPPAEGRLEAGSLRALVPTPAAPLAPPAPVALPSVPDTRVPTLGAAVAAPPTAAATAAPAEPSPATARAAPAPDDTGPRLGADVAVPATAASAPKRLNLELGRLRGGELSRHGSAGVLPVLPRPPETDKLASEIEKAARADCTKAYAGAGILAVVPLAVDAVRGKGCKW